MQRTVVYRVAGLQHFNVNNEIGLEPFASYTLKDYLEDLAGEGIRLLSVSGPCHVFSDHSVQILQQKQERIDLSQMDEATLMVVLLSVSGRMPVQAAMLERLAC